MNILLLGSNGQLGSDIRLLSKSIPELKLNSLYRENLDITNLEEIGIALEKHDFDVLINCTSYHKTDEVEENPKKALVVNSYAVMELARACRKTNSRLLHISTDYVFNGKQQNPYKETSTPGPLNVYGATKLIGENLALIEHSSILIFRVASLFGLAGASGKGGNFVETILRIGMENDSIKIVDDQFMSPTSTKHVASIILESIQKDIPSGIYNVVNSGQASWYEFARKIIECSKIDCEVIPITSSEYVQKARRPSFSVLDNSKISAFVGKIDAWEDALLEYLHDSNTI